MATAILLLQLFAVIYFDLSKLIIPNALNLTIAASGVATRSLELNGSPFSSFMQMGMVYLLFVLFDRVYEVLRKRRGMGGGDIKFLAAATAWIGLEQLPWLILLASLSGLFFAIGARAFGKLGDISQKIPFGPHLSFGLITVWVMWA